MNERTQKQTRASIEDKILSLSLKYIQDQASDEEGLELLDELTRNLRKSNQALFDRLSAEIEKKDEALGERWREFIEPFSGSFFDLVGLQGQDMEATLFLIPVVIGFDSKQEGQSDSLNIVKLGEIRKLLVKHGLISGTEENVGFLTEFFTFDEIASFNETKRFNLIQLFLTQNKKYAMSRNDRIPTGNLPVGTFDLRLKFLVACAQLKSDHPSPLSKLLIPSDDELNSKEMDKTVQFLNELTGVLPQIIQQREEVNVKFCAVFSMVELSRFGLKLTFGEYSQFKWSLLLAQAMELESPRILMSQDSPEFMDITLFNEDDLVNQIQIHTLHETQEDLDEFLNDFFNDLESRGFSLESDHCDVLTFSKRIRQDRNQRSSRPLQLLH